MVAGDSLIDIINDHLANQKIKLPAFHPTALRVQREIANEDPDIRLIEKLIVGDQALTGQVLSVSNSSFYKGLRQIVTVRDAIIRLGINEVSNIVMMVTHENHFRSNDPFIHQIMRQLWRHSVGAALGSHWVARHCGFQGLSNETFFAGLLHDVGKLFILTVIDDLKHSGRMNAQPSNAIVDEAMTALHTDYGYSLMSHWNLPDSYCRVARDHHAETVDPTDFLLVIVRLANLTCKKLGIALSQDASIVLSATPEAERLRLSELDLARLEVRLEDSQVFGN
jgi:HD-like signal output (HDOD) protein